MGSGPTKHGHGHSLRVPTTAPRDPSSTQASHSHRASISSARERGLESTRSSIDDFEGVESADERTGSYHLARQRIRNRHRYAILYVAIFCIAFAISLDSNTGYLYLNWACSEYGALSAFSTVSIVQQLTLAIAKPPLAKISDVFGRAQAYSFSLALYAGGYIIVTFSSSLRSLLCGLLLVSAGTTGLQTLQSIIVADTTAPRYRGLVIGLCNLPYLINFLTAGPLVDLVLRHGTWRLGYGIWIVAMPIAAAPLLITLTIGQRRARRAGLRHRILDGSQNVSQTLHILAKELDVLGIILFSLSFALMLLPVTLVGHGSSFDTGLTKILFLLGLILVVVFVRWEGYAGEPLLPLRFFSNRTVVLVCLIGVSDFGSFFLSWSFLSSFVQVVKGWDSTKTGWVASTQNVTSTAQGIIVGLLMARHRRFKHIIVYGVIIRLIGVSLMIKFRSANDHAAVLVLCQLLQGIGGGSIAIVMQVAVQITVQRKDVAAVTALELLTAEIGAAIGSAMAGVLFAMDLPKQLATSLPTLSLKERDAIYSSLQVALSYPMGSPIRDGIIQAWVNTMRLLCVTATIFLIPALFFAIALPNLQLPEKHYQKHRLSSARHKRRASSSSRRRRVASAPAGANPPPLYSSGHDELVSPINNGQNSTRGENGDAYHASREWRKLHLASRPVSESPILPPSNHMLPKHGREGNESHSDAESSDIFGESTDAGATTDGENSAHEHENSTLLRPPVPRHPQKQGTS